jgi:hypothetical protein
MTDPTPNRRPFQFSLRKLLLWTAVVAFYCGLLSRFPPPKDVTLTLIGGSVVVSLIRVVCDDELTFSLSVFGGIGVGILLAWLESRSTPVMGIVFGGFFGLFCFLVVFLPAKAVDWIDEKMAGRD